MKFIGMMAIVLGLIGYVFAGLQNANKLGHIKQAAEVIVKGR